MADVYERSRLEVRSWVKKSKSLRANTANTVANFYERARLKGRNTMANGYESARL